MWKKILSLLCCCAYAIGVVGGIGWSLYSSAELVALCVAALAYLAFPEALKHYKRLIGAEDPQEKQ